MDEEQESILDDDSDGYEDWEYEASLRVRDLAVERGWVNIRNWDVSGEPEGAWMVTVFRLNKRTIENIEKWGDYMLKNYPEVRLEPVVVFIPGQVEEMIRTTFEKIGAGYLEVGR